MFSKSFTYASSLMKLAVIAAGLVVLSACAPKVEREFKQGCKAAGGNNTFCSCIYDQLESHYGKENLKSFAEMKQLPPSDFEERTYQYTASCASKWK